MIKQAILGRLLNATGVGPVMNLLKQRSLTEGIIGRGEIPKLVSDLAKTTSKVDKLAPQHAAIVEKINKLQDVWLFKKFRQRPLPDLVKKEQALSDSLTAQQALQRAGTKSIGRAENKLQKLKDSLQGQTADVKNLYGTLLAGGGLAAAGHYGSKALDQEEEKPL